MKNPAFITRSYQADGVAPGGDRVVWQYTVDRKRVFRLDEAALRVTRETAAAPVGIARATVYVTPPGKPRTAMRDIMLLTNTAGDERDGTLGLEMPLPAGSVVEAHVSDTSTGGTVSFLVSLLGVEHDPEA